MCYTHFLVYSQLDWHNIPARTGNDNNNKTAVITTAQPNNANLCNLIPGLLILIIVVMTLKLDYILSASLYDTVSNV